MSATKEMRKASLPLLLALLGLACGAPEAASAAAPFSGLAGTWTGDGSIALTKGTTERIKCDATYIVGTDGEKVDLTLRCASDSYHFDLHIGLVDTAGAVLGNWSEPTQNVEGGISGTASNGLIKVTARGQNFTAAVTVATHGAAQTVQISAQSGDLSRVAIALRHSH
jgi:hypothetical protein